MNDEPHRNDRRRRYAILARLRRVERRFEVVDRRWSEFRDRPSPARLDTLRRSVSAAERELSSLSEALQGETTVQPEGTADKITAPSPRDLVDAVRELDSLINGTYAAWSASRGAPEAGSLLRISGMLARAEQGAGTLERALGPLSPRGGETAATAAVGDSLLAGGREETLDGLILRLHQEWETLRRRPTVDRTRHLRVALAEARRHASDLAALAGSGSTLATPEALCYLSGAAEAVRFPPYRDPDTGSYNGRGFEVSAAAELERCARYGKPFGLIVLSLAERGASSARPVIGAIKSLLRNTDITGRLAADQLAIALPESDGRTTRRVAARILRALDAAQHGGAVRRLAYAVSPEEGRTLLELLSAARTRLEV